MAKAPYFCGVCHSARSLGLKGRLMAGQGRAAQQRDKEGRQHQQRAGRDE